MRQPRAEQVAFMVQKNLGFVDQPAKGRRVNNAIAVPLKVGARGRLRLGKAAPTGAGWI
jgi:hypothetical protein